MVKTAISELSPSFAQLSIQNHDLQCYNINLYGNGFFLYYLKHTICKLNMGVVLC